MVFLAVCGGCGIGQVKTFLLGSYQIRATVNHMHVRGMVSPVQLKLRRLALIWGGGTPNDDRERWAYLLVTPPVPEAKTLAVEVLYHVVDTPPPGGT